MADDNPQPPAPPDQSAPAGKPSKPAKEKAPAVESKPLAEFMEQDYLPALKQSLAKQGIEGVVLTFVQQKIPVKGYERSPACWQVQGQWTLNRQVRQFNVYFFDGDLQGQRGFSCTDSGLPSTMESFRIDERKMTLDLLVAGVLQRLNAQKWLARN
jgi:hypothetical protein